MEKYDFKANFRKTQNMMLAFYGCVLQAGIADVDPALRQQLSDLIVKYKELAKRVFDLKDADGNLLIDKAVF